MARVDFDDDVESKNEFWNLLDHLSKNPTDLKNRDVALGQLVRFFRLAQHAYKHMRSVTEDELKEHGLYHMIKTKWALPHEGGYQVKNPEKHFAWVIQKVEAGKKSGESRRKKRLTDVQQTLTSVEHSKGSVEPLSLAPALAPAQKKKKTKTCDSPLANRFSEIWQLYPRKAVGDQLAASALFKSQIRTEADLTELKKAVETYAQEIRDKSTEEQFVKKLSNFLREGFWKSYTQNPEQTLAVPLLGANTQQNSTDASQHGDYERYRDMYRQERMEHVKNWARLHYFGGEVRGMYNKELIFSAAINRMFAEPDAVGEISPELLPRAIREAEKRGVPLPPLVQAQLDRGEHLVPEEVLVQNWVDSAFPHARISLAKGSPLNENKKLIAEGVQGDKTA